MSDTCKHCGRCPHCGHAPPPQVIEQFPKLPDSVIFPMDEYAPPYAIKRYEMTAPCDWIPAYNHTTVTFCAT